MKRITPLIGVIMLLGSAGAFANIQDGEVSLLSVPPSLSEQNEVSNNNTANRKRVKLGGVIFRNNRNNSDYNYTRCAEANQVLALLSSKKFILLTDGCGRDFSDYVLTNVRALIRKYDEIDGYKRIRLGGIIFRNNRNNSDYNYIRCAESMQVLSLLSNNRVSFLTDGCQGSSYDYILTNVRAIVTPPDLD